MNVHFETVSTKKDSINRVQYVFCFSSKSKPDQYLLLPLGRTQHRQPLKNEFL